MGIFGRNKQTVNQPLAPQPAVKVTPKSHYQKVLEHLKARGTATNVELSKPWIGGLRFHARISELRKDGYKIVCSYAGKPGWFNYSFLGHKDDK